MTNTCSISTSFMTHKPEIKCVSSDQNRPVETFKNLFISGINLVQNNNEIGVMTDTGQQWYCEIITHSKNHMIKCNEINKINGCLNQENFIGKTITIGFLNHVPVMKYRPEIDRAKESIKKKCAL